MHSIANFPGSDGLFPRLNEVYLYVTETNNTLKAMRGLLNLGLSSIPVF